MRYTCTVSILSVFLLTACAGQPVDKNKSYNILGVSVMAPQDDGWQLGDKSLAQVSFSKTGEAPGKSYIAGASTMDMGSSAPPPSPEEFLNASKARRAQGIDPQRFKVLVSEERLDPARGRFCTAYHTLVRDHGSNAKGNEPYQIMDNFGYTCIHPSKPNLLIDAAYSVRGGTQQESPRIAQQAARFLNNTKFTSTEVSNYVQPPSLTPDLSEPPPVVRMLTNSQFWE